MFSNIMNTVLIDSYQWMGLTSYSISDHVQTGLDLSMAVTSVRHNNINNTG